MNILFLYSLYEINTPEKPLLTPETAQMGISYISALLKKHGHKTSLLVMSRTSGDKFNHSTVEDRISEFKPDVIAFSSVSTEFRFITELAAYTRRLRPSAYLIAGGAHVSLNPEGVLDHFDALCIGEGEFPMLELVSQLSNGIKPKGIQNLWIRSGDTIEKNIARPFLQDLDMLPFPDRELWNDWIAEIPGSRYSVLLGRGCPFDCSYCSNHALKKLAAGLYTRYRDPGMIVTEIRELHRQHPDKTEFYLEVESIGVNKKWVVELCGKLGELNKTLKKPLSYGANLRIMPNLDLKTIFGAFREANFRFINIGLESGCERVRREVLNRNYSNDDILAAVKTAREFGLKVAFLNMLGLPTETLREFKETVEMNRKCLPDWASYSIFYPYPGTNIYDFCAKEGLIGKNPDTVMERGKAVLDLPGFTKRQIQKEYTWFEFNVYKGHRPLGQLLKKAVSLKIKANPFLYRAYKTLKKYLKPA